MPLAHFLVECGEKEPLRISLCHFLLKFQHEMWQQCLQCYAACTDVNTLVSIHYGAYAMWKFPLQSLGVQTYDLM